MCSGELVGVSSYLLIGFYYTKPEAIAASKKAFIVTRFADLGFLIGILIYGYYMQTSPSTWNRTPDAGRNGAALGIGTDVHRWCRKECHVPAAHLVAGCHGRSDTGICLIHAATMVVAGVYLVARMFPLFIGYAPEVLHWIAYIGAFTAFYAASVACVQSDIKRVLAFSTISSNWFYDGGTGSLYFCRSTSRLAWVIMAGMFHLFTHAMFKHCSSFGGR